jgi:hypothetical protein
MGTTRNTPTLDEVADATTLARELPSTAIAALLAKRAAPQSAQAAALAAGCADGHDTASPSSTDSLLTVRPASMCPSPPSALEPSCNLELSRALNVDARP